MTPDFQYIKITWWDELLWLEVPAAYVGRPPRPDDLVGPYFVEDACHRRRTLSAAEKPDFSSF
jgi:hypothetical protein